MEKLLYVTGFSIVKWLLLEYLWKGKHDSQCLAFFWEKKLDEFLTTYKSVSGRIVLLSCLN